MHEIPKENISLLRKMIMFTFIFVEHRIFDIITTVIPTMRGFKYEDLRLLQLKGRTGIGMANVRTRTTLHFTQKTFSRGINKQNLQMQYFMLVP